MDSTPSNIVALVIDSMNHPIVERLRKALFVILAYSIISWFKNIALAAIQIFTGAPKRLKDWTPQRSVHDDVTPSKPSLYQCALESVPAKFLHADLYQEYPQLRDATYLDHAGTTIYAKSLFHAWMEDLSSNLYGNPHSASSPSIRASNRIQSARARALHFFQASSDHFDLVFVPNATAAINLVSECFRDYAASHAQSFWYGYHNDAHTSLVGVRERCDVDRCFMNDEEVTAWISGEASDVSGPPRLSLFAYPGQSNFNGRRLPLDWSRQVRASPSTSNVFTLLDAAALASTSCLDLSNSNAAPDFVVLSFYKIFGFPNIGALIVRKDSGKMLASRRYFGGGTVEMVVNANGNKAWHVEKASSIHDRLEEGTLPFLGIIALSHAIDKHKQLYGNDCMRAICEHTSNLVRTLYERLMGLKHENGKPMVRIYKNAESIYGDPSTQGAVLTFNVLHPDGTFLRYRDVEQAADRRRIYVRSGSLCNPGGMATHLGWSMDEMREAYANGHKCSDPQQMVLGKPTGAVRVSLGAMSTETDVSTFVDFIRELHFLLPSDDTMAVAALMAT